MMMRSTACGRRASIASVALADLAPGALDADALDGILSLAQARGVDDVQRNAFDLYRLAQGIARGAGDLGDDGAVFAGELVQQAGLADVGLTHQHHVQATAQQCALARAIENVLQLLTDGVESRQRARLLEKLDLLFREIEGGFDQHAQINQRIDNAVNLFRESARKRAQRRARGGGGGRLDEISNALGLGQIELAIEKGAARELARLGQAGAQLQTALEQHLHDDRAAMALQLEHVFTSEGRGGGKVERDALVERHPVSIKEAGKHCLARDGDTAAQRGRKLTQAGTRDADDTDATAARRRRNRRNRVSWPCCPTVHFRSSV